MPTKAQLKKKIKEFIESSNEEFQVPTIFKYLQAEFDSSELTEKEKMNVLEIVDYDLNNLLVSKDIPIPDDDKYVEEFYISRKTLFSNSKFLIKPTNFELKHGILITGHRFTPFCSPKLFTDKIKLLNTENNRNISKKKIIAKMEDIVIYYNILGLSILYEELSRFDDNIEKMMDVSNFNQDFCLNVYNMSAFYRKNSFGIDDYILVEVKDYNKGICDIEYLPIESLKNSIGDINNWCMNFESAIIETVNKYENCSFELDVSKQLSEAFYMADRTLLEKPVIHIGGFLGFSKEIEMVNVEATTLFWEKNRKFTSPKRSLLNEKLDMFQEEDIDVFNDEIFGDKFSDILDDELSQNTAGKLPVNKQKSLRTLDSILEYMGYSLGKGEVEGYMRDELYSGGNDLKNVLNRCYDNRDEYYPEAAQKLYVQTEKLWEKVKKNYNVFADKRIGKLRSQVLELSDKNLKWLRNIDSSGVSFSDIPNELVDSLMEITAQLMHLITDFNKPNKFKEKDIKQMERMLEQTFPMFSMVLDQANETIDELKDK